LVSDIDTVRRTLGVNSITLVGHSFGGTLALEYAARYPEHVKAVVFAGGLWDAPHQTVLRCRYTNRALSAVARRVLADSGATRAAAADDCSWMGRLPAPERDSLQNAMMFPDRRVLIRLDSIETATGRRNTGQLGGALGRAGLGRYRFTAFDKLTMPVLVMAGRFDGAAVVSGSQELVDKLPNATLLEFENSGHFMYLDETARFARELIAFVERTR
jgi:proline iminopeptidase